MKLVAVFILILLSITCNAKISDEKHLDDFDNVELFENYLKEKQQKCLDKSYGGSKAVNCFSAHSQAWDIELNYFYKLFHSKLNNDEKAVLKSAQLAWIKYRDKTIDFNSIILDKKYANKQGTMYIAMRSGDASRAIVPIIKKRAILLSNWYKKSKKI